MKIVFDKQTVCNAIFPLLNTVSNKGTVASAEGILIEAESGNLVTLTSFDLDKGTQTQIECDVIESGKCVIKAQKFAQTLRVMEEDNITVTVDEKMSVTIESGKARSKMIAMKAEEFTPIPKLTSESGFEISQKVLKRMFQKVSYAIGVNDQRPILNGCFIMIADNSLLMAACDSFRLARCQSGVKIGSIGGENRFRFIVPGKAVNELVKLLDDADENKTATIYMSKKNIVVNLENYVFFSKLIEGEYIDFDRIIMKNHKIQVVLDRVELISALERAALVTEEKMSGGTPSHVKLVIEDNTIKVSAISTMGSVYDEVHCDHTGDNMSIAFNNKFLMESIRACAADTIKIEMSSAHCSINIIPADEDAENDLFMVLPVKMVE